MSVAGRVLRIERSSNKDGFGIRTVVFFKGCPLRCEWCSTPESQSLRHETGIMRSCCTLCGKCAEVCPENIIQCSLDGGITVDNSLCIGCNKCKNICPHDAVRVYGRDMSSDEVIAEISKDDIFFHHGGGLTLSGGEVFYQPLFAKDILKKSFELGIDNTIETCGYGKWELISPMLNYLPTIFIDLKLMDPAKHKFYTGVDNAVILENIKKIDSTNKTKTTIRVPFIPSVNDDTENYEQMAEFCTKLNNLSAVEILRYHRLGIETYRNLGREVPFPYILPPTKEEILKKIKPLYNLKDVSVQVS